MSTQSSDREYRRNLTYAFNILGRWAILKNDQFSTGFSIVKTIVTKISDSHVWHNCLISMLSYVQDI